MQPKLKEKRIAHRLRKQGLSYNEILQKIPVAKSSVSLWCQDIELTPEQKDRLIKKKRENLQRLSKLGPLRALKRQKEIRKIKKVARKEIRSLTPDELKVAGAALYWGEGNKKSLAISNSDPNLINFIMRWFREICQVPNKKIRACLYLHTGQNEEKMKKYWSRITNIPLIQFNKTIFKQEGSASRKYSQSQYKGTIKIQVFDEDLKHRILAWIEQL